MTSRLVLALAVASALSLTLPGCEAQSEETAAATGAAASGQDGTSADASASNPFFAESTLPLQYPPFDKISDADYAPAFERGMAEHLQEIRAIADNGEAPTFENTIVAMERAGQVLDRVSTVFFSVTGTDINDTLKALQTEIAPKLAAHRDAVLLDDALYARVKALYDQRDSLGLDPESARLLERYHTDFVRAGAQLSEADKAKLKDLNAELATLQTQFTQNVLNEVNASAVVVDDRAELEGLSEATIKAAADTAKARGMDGKYVITLLNTTQQPVLDSLANRDLRKRVFEASVSRNSRGNEFDNTGVVSQIAKLRAQRAALLGFDNHADYQLADSTAGSIEAVNARLSELAAPAVRNARKEAADLQAMIDAEGGDFELAPWDWQYYTEKLRAERYDIDEAALKPYFELDSVLQNGVFYAANKLYGLTFKERTDLPTYNPDVRVFDVFDANGEQLAIFTADFYARDSKRGGAWMNSFVSQSDLMGTKPIVTNNLNIKKPSEGEPTLLTFDEVTTMFHEFGHALHGMFSDVTYPRFSGTSVPRDYVEFPSQVNEMWATWPEVLANYAKHYQTGEAMPQELLDKVLASEKFNQGFATTEYLGASLLDQAWHQKSADALPDADGVMAFEAEALADAGVDYEPVPPRYRTPYFSHTWGGGYSAGYYGYIWAETLDADTVEWFKENGGLKRENGDHFRKTLLSQGGSKDAMQLFRDFRGRDAEIEPLLERRGLN
ncbi:M3 family metallopeptidase [Coralloluteibacterium stylophorae]|uniref:Dipeptidyl carboxypeptidase n=3 Tax=Coralloluteibacterium stylophorae TaxID=1776034 RepID=A0AAP2FYT8_9GAMM|nr:M3 family metallopeptidase [Coralloluteibacterium stylophorae]MBS7455628.1 M3 family metallopeptidase [Coralloluteibacterium stylophorae]